MLTKEELLKLKDQAESEKTRKIQLETQKETLVKEIITKFEVKDSKELLAKMETTKKELSVLEQDIKEKSEAFREKWDV